MSAYRTSKRPCTCRMVGRGGWVGTYDGKATYDGAGRVVLGGRGRGWGEECGLSGSRGEAKSGVNGERAQMWLHTGIVNSIPAPRAPKGKHLAVISRKSSGSR